MPAAASNAATPGRGSNFRLSSPCLTIIRFSSVNDMTSATVPKAAKSKTSSAGSSSKADTTLKATPAPERPPNGYEPSG